MYVCVPHAQCPQRPEKGIGSPGTGVTGSYEPPHECWKKTQVFWKNSKWFLNARSFPSTPMFGFKSTFLPTASSKCASHKPAVSKQSFRNCMKPHNCFACKSLERTMQELYQKEELSLRVCKRSTRLGVSRMTFG